jgi:hypothetical protein
MTQLHLRWVTEQYYQEDSYFNNTDPLIPASLS